MTGCPPEKIFGSVPPVCSREPQESGTGERIQRAVYRKPALVKDVGIDHSGAHIFMAEEVLDGPDVVAVFQEMGGETVAEGMRGALFGDSRLPDGGFDGTLGGSGIEMMPSDITAAWIFRARFRWKEELPAPFAVGQGIFCLQGVGEGDVSESFFQVFLIQGFDFPEVRF